jgi:outer membrane protein assembly factor BamD (BamD/ComL family)
MAKSPRRPPQPAIATKRSPDVSAPSSPLARDRTSQREALALYEHAMRLLQQHSFVKAAELFGQLNVSHPEERDLLERSRLYLAICNRQLSPATSDPTDNRERLYAATLALNAGRLDEAVRYLDHICMDEPATIGRSTC